MTGEYVPVEAVLPIRTRVGELVCECGLDSDDLGKTERLPGEDAEGVETFNEIGLDGLFARGGVGACSRNEGAVGS